MLLPSLKRNMQAVSSGLLEPAIGASWWESLNPNRQWEDLVLLMGWVDLQEVRQMPGSYERQSKTHPHPDHCFRKLLLWKSRIETSNIYPIQHKSNSSKFSTQEHGFLWGLFLELHKNCSLFGLQISSALTSMQATSALQTNPVCIPTP